jgi:hypothetical protein
MVACDGAETQVANTTFAIKYSSYGKSREVAFLGDREKISRNCRTTLPPFSSTSQTPPFLSPCKAHKI